MISSWLVSILISNPIDGELLSVGDESVRSTGRVSRVFNGELLLLTDGLHSGAVIDLETDSITPS